MKIELTSWKLAEDSEDKVLKMVGEFEVQTEAGLKIASQSFGHSYGAINVNFSRDILEMANKLNALIKDEIEGYFNEKE